MIARCVIIIWYLLSLVELLGDRWASPQKSTFLQRCRQPLFFLSLLPTPTPCTLALALALAVLGVQDLCVEKRGGGKQPNMLLMNLICKNVCDQVRILVLCFRYYMLNFGEPLWTSLGNISVSGQMAQSWGWPLNRGLTVTINWHGTRYCATCH